MSQAFKVGDRVEWNSEAGYLIGTITTKVTTEINFKGYVRHASEKDPQFIIKNDTNNLEVMQRGALLRPARKNKALVASR
jgi:Hypervirulence associated proteins TUDOR domain